MSKNILSKRFNDLTAEQQKGAGIYAHLYLNKTHIYIGQALNIKSRSTSHKNNFLNNKGYISNLSVHNLGGENKVVEQLTNPYILELNPSNLDISEAEYIQHFFENNNYTLLNKVFNVNSSVQLQLYCYRCEKYYPRVDMQPFSNMVICRKCYKECEMLGSFKPIRDLPQDYLDVIKEKTERKKQLLAKRRARDKERRRQAEMFKRSQIVNND